MKKIATALFMVGLGLGLISAKAPTPECHISEPSFVLNGLHIPTDRPTRITFSLGDAGGGQFISTDGTLTIPIFKEAPFTAYLVQRGGRNWTDLKLGSQLNDYHIVAYCEAPQ